MQKIRLSIIIPVYNSEKYLKECLESLIKMKGNFFEIVLINDGSSDGSSEICNFYKDKINNCKYYENKNIGCSQTRNFGIQESKGDYITFLDSDDYYLENTNFYKLVSLMDENDLDLIVFGYRKGDGDKSVEFRPMKTESKEYLFNSKLYFNVPWNKIYKKQILNGIRFPSNSHMGEDLAFNFMTMVYVNKVLVIDEVYYYYRENFEGVSYNGQKILDIFKSFDCIFDFFSDKTLNSYYRKKLRKLYINNAVITPYIAFSKIKKNKIDYIDFFNQKQKKQKVFSKYFGRIVYFFDFYGQMRFKYSGIFENIKKKISKVRKINNEF